jgi:hypothetical protein
LKYGRAFFSTATAAWLRGFDSAQSVTAIA